jgi:predicted O-methyltransferase YrrM
VHAVDPYLPDPTTPEVSERTREIFYENVRRGGHVGRVFLYEGRSAEVLAWMAATDGFRESFHFIYIDGSHLAKDVFIDAALSWNLLKIGGLIGFDDYHWGDPNDPLRRPQIAIDAFERVFADRLTLVLDGNRRFYRKLLA